nr:haloacid dehalogenase-like hydrolase domain-containing protein 3 [Ipomoea batatas]
MAAARTTARITGALTRLTRRSMTRSFLGGSGDGYLPEPYGISGSSFSTTAAAAEESPERMFGLLKDYEDYRRAMYGGLTHKALLVDAVGTLVIPSQPMAQIYRQIGEKYGVEYSEAEILNRYRRAYEQPWSRSRLRLTGDARRIAKICMIMCPASISWPIELLIPGSDIILDWNADIEKYVNDGRPFWQHIVSSSTGCSDSQYFEELYNYYTTNKAWHLCDPDAERVFQALRNAGVKLAIVSNFDTRLRPLLRDLNCDHWFDAVAVSAEVTAYSPFIYFSVSDARYYRAVAYSPSCKQVEAEKPNPMIFLKACELLGVNPEDAVHVGDDRRNDIWGGRDAGCDAWLWGSDVHSFKESAAEWNSDLKIEKARLKLSGDSRLKVEMENVNAAEMRKKLA